MAEMLVRSKTVHLEETKKFNSIDVEVLCWATQWKSLPSCFSMAGIRSAALQHASSLALSVITLPVAKIQQLTYFVQVWVFE